MKKLAFLFLAFILMISCINQKIEYPVTGNYGPNILSSENINFPENFNDFDDYNCYKTIPKVDTLKFEGTNRKIIFNTFCRVDYVNQNSPNTISSIRTWHKRMVVSVIATGMTDTIKMSSVYSYWYFR